MLPGFATGKAGPLVAEDLRGRGTINILPIGTPTAGGETVTEAKPFMVYGVLMNAGDLQKAIEERRAKDPALRVYLRVDRNADFALVRRAIKSCAAAGVFDIIFGTFQSRSNES